MFCPECRSEYEEGIDACADCGARLVAELPPEEPSVEYEEVSGDLTAVDVATVRSLLDGEGIDYYIKGELFSVGPNVEPGVLLVRKDQAQETRAMLRELLEGTPGAGPDADRKE